MGAFDYPAEQRPLRHGPEGYRDYQSYRPWLRDEFDFRCVYCLIREQWGRVTGEFDIDHFVPQRRTQGLQLEYDNLLYACRSCNLIKGDQDIPDPRIVLIGSQIRVAPDGSVIGLTDSAQKIIEVMGLNSDSYRLWRVTWIRIIELARNYDQDLYQRLMGFPRDLPNLSLLRPPRNTRPQGIAASYFARQSELPETY